MHSFTHSSILLTECPRDAMQGIARFIPTADKIRYLNALLRVGFDRLDFGSFVSPKAVPQLQDTAQVLAGLDLSQTSTQLLAIVGNLRGVREAVSHAAIRYVGFPLSVSETFQQRNTNTTIQAALTDVTLMHDLCQQADKELVVYLSMAFGNPYGDPHSPALVLELVSQLNFIGIGHIVPSDTVGTAKPEDILVLFETLSLAFPHQAFGLHLHARPGETPAKVWAAVQAGVSHLDGAIGGYGGCPFATDTLTGNLPTEEIVATLDQMGIQTSLDRATLAEAIVLSKAIF